VEVKGNVPTGLGIEGNEGCPGVEVVCVPHQTDDGVDGHQLESFTTMGGHLAKFHLEEVDGFDSMGHVAIRKVEH
jgi:hypothetical protein